MMKTSALTLLALASTAVGEPGYSQYGGWKAIQREATGFFRTEQVDGEWWLIDPEGYVFFSKGVNHVTWKDYKARNPEENYPYWRNVVKKYGEDRQPWEVNTLRRLRHLGLNTIGSWSDAELYARREMPYTQMIGIAWRAGAQWFQRVFCDVYSERFRQGVKTAMQEVVLPKIDDPWLIGYFLDNELPWNVGADAYMRILVFYLALEPDAPGKARAIEFLRSRYEAIDRFNAAWGENFASWEELQVNRRFLYPEHAALEMPLRPAPARVVEDGDLFLAMVAQEYFRICHEELRAVDQKHLILGTRLAWANEKVWPVVRAAQPYIDVLTINNYWPVPFIKLYQEFSAAIGKPVMVTEFSFVSTEGPHPNTLGAAKGLERIFPTERMRARQFGNYVMALIESPVVVGYHWFEWYDQPLSGRVSDGENQSFGIVTLQDELYPALSQAMRQVNAGLEAWKQQTPEILWPPAPPTVEDHSALAQPE